MDSSPSEPKKKSRPVKNESAGGRCGRPSPVDNRTGRFNLYLSQETLDRFNLAFPKEQKKQREEGRKVDKSFVIEMALGDWFEKNGY